MTDASSSPTARLRVGLILFDAARTRVFAVRSARIEDAREYAVNRAQPLPAQSSPAAARDWASRADEQLTARATQTARLVTELDSAQPFDCLLLGGPSKARDLLWQKLPTQLQGRVMGSLNLEVAAGESAIVGAALPAVAGLAGGVSSPFGIHSF